VTSTSEAKSRKLIRSLAKRYPKAEVIVTGCSATLNPEQIRELPGVTELITDKRLLSDFLIRRGLEKPPQFPDAMGTRSRMYLKIQDGCNAYCAYCIVPHARPYLTSRNCEEIVCELNHALGQGYREIVLTGTHLGLWDIDGQNLPSLITQLLECEGDYRLRLSSLEASEVTEELLALFTSHPHRLCPHLHLPMQSGSDVVLQRMGRRQSASQFLETTHQIREALTLPAITCDVIVGLPGERDSDFDQTCELVRRGGISKAHVFRYSPREGTAAAKMDDQVPEPVKNERAKILAEIATQQRLEFVQKMQGQQETILIEKSNDNVCQGTSARYLTTKINLQGDDSLRHQLVEVVIDSIEGEILLGRRVG